MTDHSDQSPRESLRIARHVDGQDKSARRKKLQKARKKLKRSHLPKRTRRKNWIPEKDGDWEEPEYEEAERIMPRDEGDRRRSLEQAAFKASEPDEAEVLPVDILGPQGLVVEVSKGFCRVDLGDTTLLCPIRGVLSSEETAYTNVVTVGDEVIISRNGSDSGVVEQVLPRRSTLARPDVFHSHLQQVLVANVDQVLIVASWREPIIWLELLDRYLIAAERNDLPAVICINKIDLVEDQAEFETTLQPYRALGYQLVPTSALTGAGIAELRTILKNRQSVLAGLSGVGKSSLLSAVQPSLELRTGVVSEHSGEGRHTTTQTTLIRLDEKSVVVDTPGIREFGLSGLRQSELSQFFPEIAELALSCRFSDCAHANEPDCAVQRALSAGEIAASRFENYRKIYNTLPA